MLAQNTRRAAIYARVSTQDQSTDLQLDELRELSRRRGWMVAKEYVDHCRLVRLLGNGILRLWLICGPLSSTCANGEVSTEEMISGALLHRLDLDDKIDDDEAGKRCCCLYKCRGGKKGLNPDTGKAIITWASKWWLFAEFSCPGDATDSYADRQCNNSLLHPRGMPTYFGSCIKVLAMASPCSVLEKAMDQEDFGELRKVYKIFW